MIHQDSDRCPFLLQMVLLGLAFLTGSVLSGCNRGATSDFTKKQQAQENAVVALTDLGAKIAKLNKDDMKGWSVDLSQVPFTPKIADQLKVLEASTKVLNLSKTLIDDSQLSDLIDQMALTLVADLDLSYNPAITDQVLEKLERLVFLRDLNLTGTQVTETIIAHLQEIRKPIDFKPKGSAKDSSDKMFNRSIPEYLKRELKIRH